MDFEGRQIYLTPKFDLVDADQRVGAAVLGGDKHPIDQTWAKGWLRHGRYCNDQIDVCCDYPLQSRIGRIRAGQNGVARQDSDHAVGAHIDLISDGEARLCPAQATLTAEVNDASTHVHGADGTATVAGLVHEHSRRRYCFLLLFCVLLEFFVTPGVTNIV
jgi:hypothetical protein